MVALVRANPRRRRECILGSHQLIVRTCDWNARVRAKRGAACSLSFSCLRAQTIGLRGAFVNDHDRLAPTSARSIATRRAVAARRTGVCLRPLAGKAQLRRWGRAGEPVVYDDTHTLSVVDDRGGVKRNCSVVSHCAII